MTYFEPKTYELQSENQPWSYATDGVNQRFEVRSGDNWTWDGTAKERSEIASYKKLAFGQTYTISYKFMVEPGQTNSADWLLVGQVHQTEDPGEPGISPPLAIEMAGERLRIVARSNPEAVSSWATTTTKTLWTDSAALERGHWYDMKLEVRFDPFGGGLVNVWRDGQKIVSYAGAIGYNDQVGTYWKHGVYREASQETFAANFSRLSIVQGSSGADKLVGGAGNDTHIVNHAKDVIVERAGQGADTAKASVSHILNANVERLILVGTAPIDATGNGLRNTVAGNAAVNTINAGSGADVVRGNGGNDHLRGQDGNDILNGNTGIDILSGGRGNDVFVFNAFLSSSNADRITDFSNVSGNNDSIRLENGVMTKLGAAGGLNAAYFRVGPTARDSDDFIVYNKTTGELFYDSNGSAPGGATLLATLTNKPTLTAADFFVV